MDYNYEIHKADGSLVEKSNYTSLPKAKAVRLATAALPRGIGAYALITCFDWQRGERTIGKING